MNVDLYNPLFHLAAIEEEGTINALDQLDEDMQGQTLTLLGHVSATTERYTKEQKKFLLVTLDLLGGQMEAVVWPDVLERTQAIWAAGKLVRATGRLRVRGDQLSLVCDGVEEYDGTPAPAAVGPAGASTNGSSTLAVNNGAAKAKSAANGVYHGNNGAAKNGRAKSAANGGYDGNNGAAKHGNNKPTANGGQSSIVSLAINESEDPVSDAHLLREVIQILLEYPGKDRVNLRIHTGGRRILMELPVVTTGYSEALRGRLEELLGLDTVEFQPVAGAINGEAPF